MFCAAGLFLCDNTWSSDFSLWFKEFESFEEEGADLRSTGNSSDCCQGNLRQYGEIGARDKIFLDTHKWGDDCAGDDDEAEGEEGDKGEFGRLKLVVK